MKARLAGTSVGATPMHRPEWPSVDQDTGAVYLTLSNDGGSPSAVSNAANPRVPNPWGSVIRWYEDRDDHAATSFSWELLLRPGPGRDAVSVAPDGSTIDSEDALGSPDRLWVDPDSRVWVQTDGAQPLDANDQMLRSTPSSSMPTAAPRSSASSPARRVARSPGSSTPPISARCLSTSSTPATVCRPRPGHGWGTV